MDVMEKSLVQSNPLVEARKEMTVSEMRLFALGLLDIMPYIKEGNDHDEEFPLSLIPPSDLEKLFKGNTGAVANMRRAIKKAFGSSIEIRKDDGVSFTLRHIYEEMHYEKNEGLYIQFHKKMRPYLLDLIGQQFTTIKAKVIFHLSGEYSWRLMELLQKQDGFLKKNGKAYLSMTIEELRFALNVPQNAYAGRMNNFRKKVLDEPIKEINESTPYKVWYDVKKQGRRVVGFDIWVKSKDAAEKAEAEKQADEKRDAELRAALEIDAIKKMAGIGISIARAKSLYDKHGEKRCLANLEHAKQTATSRTENLAGYAIDCIEKDSVHGQDLFDQMTEEEHAEVQQHHINKIHEQAKSGADEVVIEHKIKMSEETHQKVLKHLEKLRGN